MSEYQTIILSGGGAKGPYGLGVLLALEKFHVVRKKKVTKIYCGTSVGALNATLAAQQDLNKLRDLYSKLRTIDVLGTNSSKVSKISMARAIFRRPFHYFRNDAIRSTIEQNVDYDSLCDSDAHLLVCATNYITGELETFYISSLMDEFIDIDQSQPEEKQRLFNYHRIESQDELIRALLASTAIPFYFPPVSINGHLYVDGGIGNNTPLRQAAYINRFLSCKADTKLEPTFCVINDPARFSIDPTVSNDIFGIIRRTMDISHNALVSDSRISWDRINQEIKRTEQYEGEFASYISGVNSMPKADQEALIRRIQEALRTTNSTTPRRDFPLEVVRPSTPLVEDILHFDPRKSKQLKEHGVGDCLALLEHKGYITRNMHSRWIEDIK